MRPASQRRLLQVHRDKILCVELRGELFFGSSQQVLQQVQYSAYHNTPRPHVKFARAGGVRESADGHACRSRHPPTSHTHSIGTENAGSFPLLQALVPATAKGIRPFSEPDEVLHELRRPAKQAGVGTLLLTQDIFLVLCLPPSAR